MPASGNAPPPAAPGTPAPPAPKKATGALVLGLVGGVIALLGAVIPWIIVQTCASAGGIISICVPVPLVGDIGTVSPILGIAPLLALLTSIVGVVLLLLQKPQMGLVAGLMGVLALVFAVLFIVSFGGNEQSILDLTGGSVSVNMTAEMSFGVYLTIIGGLLLAVGGFLQWMKLKGPAAAA